ncbi:MAG TPA: nuclear transport factor 2 family protein [Ktedonobacterales bacterium]|nr:nuclear transport factor 2 family protein [Ktedonobacterales bacterium]
MAGDPAGVLAALADCWQRGDADSAAALFATDAVYREPPAFAFAGRAAIHAFFADFAGRHHAVTFEVVRVLAAPDGALAAAEWRFAHTRTSDGKRAAYAGMCWIELRAGLVTRWQGYSAALPTA